MFESLFTSALLQAAGMAILHSLWQATLLAILLWVVSRYTSLKAEGRYRLAFSTLLLQAAVSGFTFGYYYEPAVTEVVATNAGGGGARNAVIVLTHSPTSLWTTAEFWLVLLVICWAAGLLVGGSRLLISQQSIHRLKRSARGFHANTAFAVLHRHVTALADRIGYRGTVRLGLTDRITGPMLVGHLKPVLLFPVAMVNQLTTEEAETVILHELAHLRRADHLFHLLQCLLEVLFYYHPAIHWIGARIREEREHCCDDLVLRYGPGQLPYARALLYFSEQTRNHAATALSLTDGGGLLARVRRFIDHQETKYTMKSRLFILPILAVATFVGTAAYAPADKAMEAPLSVEIPSAPALAAPFDTLPPGTHEVTRISNGQVTKLRVSDQQITELTIDGVVPPGDYEAKEGLAEELLGIKPLPQRFDRKWEFNFPPDSLLRLAERTLEATMPMMDSLRKRKGLYFFDSTFSSPSGRAFQWSMDAESEAKRFEALTVDLDSLRELYGRTITRINLDSLIGAASKLSQEHLELDSLSFSWSNRRDSSYLRPFTFQREGVFRRSGESDMEYLDRQEAGLREQLRALEAQKKALKDSKAIKRNSGLGFGHARLPSDHGGVASAIQ